MVRIAAAGVWRHPLCFGSAPQGYLAPMTDTPAAPSSAKPLQTEESGQATTAEEAMDAVTTEDGHVRESAYAPTEPDAKDPEPQSDSQAIIEQRAQRR